MTASMAASGEHLAYVAEKASRCVGWHYDPRDNSPFGCAVADRFQMNVSDNPDEAFIGFDLYPAAKQAGHNDRLRKGCGFYRLSHVSSPNGVAL